VFPVQTGELLPGEGAVGIGLITAVVVPKALVQPFKVTVTEYVPALAEVAPVMLGFCDVELNEAGPLHEYVAPTRFDAVRFNVDPSQIGELFPAVGVAGVVFTVTAIVEGELAQPLLMMSVYVPAAAAVTLVMDGF
jgi:hypothetical protein